jgi:cytochrome c553
VFRLYSVLAIFVIGFGINIGLAPIAHAGSQSLVQALAQRCVGCHGEQGISTTPGIPHLANQNAGYMVKALKKYRSGERADVTLGAMNSIASALSDAEIAAIAAHFANYKGTPPQVETDLDSAEETRLVKNGYIKSKGNFCHSCHSLSLLNDQASFEAWPNLAGQQAEYLFNQMVAFRDDKRTSTVMNKVIRWYLSGEEDYKAIALYYSRQKISENPTLQK